MADSPEAQLKKLQKSIATLEAQRAILGDEALEPALAALRQQIAAIEAQLATPAPETSSTASEDRRVVTILFSDIVGSTALAEKLDPEEWTEIIKPAFDSLIPPVYEHGGTVARLMGDAILAFFGAPEAHEDDAERAILAGLAIVERVGEYNERLRAERNIELKVRVGINTGLVVVGQVGTNHKSEYTAMGDPINLASRLQSAAPPGNILISHDTYRYVRGVFDVTPQPPLTVKGKSEPVKTYVVQRARAHPFRAALRGVAGIQTRTVGREQELERLKAAFVEASTNQGIVWAQLLGEPGVGKSRLIEEMVEWLDVRPDEFSLLRARAFLGDTGQAFTLVRRMWFDRFQIAEDVLRTVAEASWVRAFCNLSGNPEEEPAQALGLLVGLSFENSPHLGALHHDPVQVRGRAFVVSRELIQTLRDRSPLVVLLEDLHWADASSWDYIVEVLLAAKEAGHGLFILGTARPEWTPPESLLALLGSSYIPIEVAPLSGHASQELVRELLRRVDGVPSQVVQSVVERSEGVPYFAEELINLFIDRGLIDQSCEPWHFVPERLKGLPLPSTLQHLLHTRLLGLPDKQRVCLQRSSIFGRHFWEGGLRALGVDQAESLLEYLQPRGFVESEEESSFDLQAEWSFHHALLREVTYESVLKRERQSLHREVGQWLETQARQAGRVDEFAGALGEHAQSAGEHREAALWFAQAGEHAKAQGATRESKHFFDRALELMPENEPERRWQILLNREEALGILGEVEARRADIAALLRLAEDLRDDSKIAEAFHRQAYILVYSGDNLACLDACSQALAAARRSADKRIELLVLSLQVPALVRSGQLDLARSTAQKALAQTHQLGDKAASMIALPRIGVYYFETGDLSTYIALMSEQIELSRELHNTFAELMGLSNIGESYSRLGLYREARIHLERAKAAAEKIGARRFRALAVENLGSVFLQTGHGRQAKELLEEALQEFQATKDVFTEQRVQLEIALDLEMSGDFGGAERRYAEARVKLLGMGVDFGVAEANAGLARCALGQGRLDESRKFLVEATQFLEHQGSTAESPFRIYHACAEGWLGLGETEAAKAIVREGFAELRVRADRLTDSGWRESFLSNVPENRAIVELAQRLEVENPYFLSFSNHINSKVTEER